MFVFSETSKKRLATCHEDLQKIAKMAIQVTPIDFGIAEGHRSIERQQELYERGLTKMDGIENIGKHNHEPSEAFDVFAYVNGSACYDKETLCLLAGVLFSCAAVLRAKGIIESNLRWGGNWDRDQVIIKDQKFQDLVHYEKD